MDPFIQNMIGTVVRWLLTMVAGWLVSANILQNGTQTEWVAAIATGLIALIWGLYKKFVDKKLLTAALSLPAGATIAEAKAQAKITTVDG